MTDTIVRPKLDDLWTLPVNPDIHNLVRHFGIEYEMFPRPSHDQVERFFTGAATEGLCQADRIHHYHCGHDDEGDCSTCDPRRDEYQSNARLFAAQHDSSCGIEFVSHILDITDPDDLTKMAAWIDYVESWKDRGEWMPDGVTSNGNHIHVSSCGGRDRDEDSSLFDDDVRRQAMTIASWAYVAYDWRRVADGGCGQLRGYNRRPTSAYDGYTWLNDRGYGTWEHRLWNTPRDPERLWASTGISVALTRWAFSRATVPNLARVWDGDTYRSLLSDISPLQSYLDHIADFKAGLIANLPDDPRFAIAAELIDSQLTIY